MSERVAPERGYCAPVVRAETAPTHDYPSSGREAHALGGLTLHMRRVEAALAAVREPDAATCPAILNDARLSLESAVAQAERTVARAQERADSLQPDAREKLDRAVASLADLRLMAQPTAQSCTDNTGESALLRSAMLNPTPRSLVEQTTVPPARGLAATMETGAPIARTRDVTDDRLRAILESGEPNEVLEQKLDELAASLDDRERRALAGRLKSYRPGKGDELAARMSRLGSGARQRILETLGGASMHALAGPLHVNAAPVATTPSKATDLVEAMQSVREAAEAAYLQLVDIDARRAAKAARAEASKKPSDPVQLTADDGRDAIVLTATSALETHIHRARTAYDQQATAPKALREQIAAASDPVQKIRAWISLRQDNARLLAAYDRSLVDFDKLRAHVGLGPLSREATQPLAQVSVEAADQERQEVHGFARTLDVAMVTAFTGLKLGAERFLGFSGLSRPPEQVAAWKELAKGILTSMLGNLIGPIVGTVLKAHSNLSEAAMQYAAGSTIDSVQAITGTITGNALQKVDGENAMRRDARLFYEALLIAQAKCNEAAAHAVNLRLISKTISAAELDQMTKDVKKADLETIAETTFHRAAHGFALLTAQRSLSIGTSGVSSMDGFFGTKQELMFGDALGERTMIGDKSGRTGVGKLHVEVFDHGTGRVAGTQITKFEIQGMNDDMAAAVLANASFQLEKLGLPVEVHFAPPWFGRHKATPMIAVDETGALRGSSSWEAFNPEHFSALSNGGTDRYPQAENAAFYATPEKLWASLHHDSIPKTAVTVR